MLMSLSALRCQWTRLGNRVRIALSKKKVCIAFASQCPSAKERKAVVDSQFVLVLRGVEAIRLNPPNVAPNIVCSPSPAARLSCLSRARCASSASLALNRSPYLLLDDSDVVDGVAKPAASRFRRPMSVRVRCRSEDDR